VIGERHGQGSARPLKPKNLSESSIHRKNAGENKNEAVTKPSPEHHKKEELGSKEGGEHKDSPPAKHQ